MRVIDTRGQPVDLWEWLDAHGIDVEIVNDSELYGAVRLRLSGGACVVHPGGDPRYRVIEREQSDVFHSVMDCARSLALRLAGMVLCYGEKDDHALGKTRVQCPGFFMVTRDPREWKKP